MSKLESEVQNAAKNSPLANKPPLGFWQVFKRVCRLRCPRCGEGKLFHGFLSMNGECDHCRLDIARESGFYLGSIYFNYGLTTIISVIVFFSFYLGFQVSPDALLWPLAAFCVIFPLLFFRHARALWLGLDVYVDKSQQ